jgi:hypothetical protein
VPGPGGAAYHSLNDYAHHRHLSLHPLIEDKVFQIIRYGAKPATIEYGMFRWFFFCVCGLTLTSFPCTHLFHTRNWPNGFRGRRSFRSHGVPWYIVQPAV